MSLIAPLTGITLVVALGIAALVALKAGDIISGVLSALASVAILGMIAVAIAILL